MRQWDYVRAPCMSRLAECAGNVRRAEASVSVRETRVVEPQRLWEEGRWRLEF